MEIADWDEYAMVIVDVYEGVFERGDVVKVDVISMTKAEEFAWLLDEVRAMPPMTPAQRAEQALCFAWGNLALDCPVSRSAFKTLALGMKDLGWTEAQFDAWAADKEWDLP